MENIDLSAISLMKVVSLIIDKSFRYEVSHINCGLGSCKKKIQVAFSSKKRLTKEYELLAIWFGDFEIHGIMRHELSLIWYRHYLGSRSRD
jgi:hypothetical protein